jgi:hypothetical protein
MGEGSVVSGQFSVQQKQGIVSAAAHSAAEASQTFTEN